MRIHKIALGVILMLLLTLGLSLMAGGSWLSGNELITGLKEVITHRAETESLPGQILWWRLPRVVGGFLSGALLAVAGSIFQRVFQNPLVAPDILGTSAGAALGTVAAVSLSGGLVLVTVGAILGGLGAATLALFVSFILGRRGVLNILVLILCGILLSSFLASVLGVWRYLTPDNGTLRGMFYIMSGGLGSVGWSEVWLLLGVAVVASLPLLLLRPFLYLLALPLDILVTQGFRVRLWSFVLLFIAASITATTVAAVGVIGWVALVVPNIVRYCTKSGKPELVMSALVGGMFLMLADTLGRSFTAAEIPVGLVTGIAGVPFFLLILYVEMRPKRG